MSRKIFPAVLCWMLGSRQQEETKGMVKRGSVNAHVSPVTMGQWPDGPHPKLEIS